MIYTIANAQVLSIITIFLITAIISKPAIKLSINLLKTAGCKRINYRNKEVVFGVGIAFVPVILTMTLPYIYFYPDMYYTYTIYIIGVSTIGFAGILDDMIGEKNIKGLRNHIYSFLHGHLTTGFVKAFIGGFTSIVISIGISEGMIDTLLNIFNMALFTNALNLMDLRPGRCAKTFILAGSIILLSNLRYIIVFLPLGIVIIIATIYLLYDLKEICMLGDTGSNILGITLGYFSALGSSSVTKLFIFLFLMSINITAEKISLTTLISNNRFLNYLDSIGRSSG